MELSLEKLRAEAWSFQGFTPPNNAKKVAEEQKGKEIFEYFMDDAGNVYYETTTSLEWKEKIAEWEKQQKKKR